MTKQGLPNRPLLRVLGEDGQVLRGRTKKQFRAFIYGNKGPIDHNFVYQAVGSRVDGAGSAQVPTAFGSKQHTPDGPTPKAGGWHQQSWSKKKKGRGYWK